MADDDNRKVIGLPEPVQNNSPATLKTLLDRLASGLDGIKLIGPELDSPSISSPNVSGPVTVSNTLVIVANSSTNQFSSNSDFNFIIHNNSVFTIKDDRALVGNNIVYHTGNYDPNLQFAKIAMRITAMEEVPINWISEITDSFDSSNGITLETRVISANTNTYTNWANYTVIDRSRTIPAGDVVTDLGFYLNLPRTLCGMKIVERLSAGSYKVLWSEEFPHPGGGPYTYQIDPPFQLPANGEFYTAIYCGTDTANFDYCSTNSLRAISTSNTSAVNTALTFTEQSGASLQTWFVSHPTVGSKNIVAANTGYVTAYIDPEYEYPVKMGGNAWLGWNLTASAQQSGYPAYLAFNKVDATSATSGSGWFTANGGTVWPQWLQMQMPVARRFTKYAITAQPSTWFTANYMPTDWTIQGSNDGTNYDILDTQTGVTWDFAVQKKYFDISNPGTYLYYKINITGNGGGNNVGINELRYWTGEEVLAANVVSEAFDLGDVTPDTVDVIALVEPIDNLTLNTDLKAYITIDEANTWSKATLTQIDSAGSIKMLRDQKIDVSNQTGTKIRWRIASPTAKNFKLHDIYVRPYVKE